MDPLSHLERQIHEAIVFINSEALDIIGTEAVNHFKESFQKEGFDGHQWQEVKRRQDPRVRGARSTRKILSGDTNELGDSITYEKEPRQVIISSDKEYAEAQNEGTSNAGRGHNVTIPARPFIAPSIVLDATIHREITQGFDRIFGK